MASNTPPGRALPGRNEKVAGTDLIARPRLQESASIAIRQSDIEEENPRQSRHEHSAGFSARAYSYTHSEKRVLFNRASKALARC